MTVLVQHDVIGYDITADVMHRYSELPSSACVHFGFKHASVLVRTERNVLFSAAAARHSFSWLV